jgi:hypothetical protein
VQWSLYWVQRDQGIKDAPTGQIDGNLSRSIADFECFAVFTATRKFLSYRQASME